MSEEEFDAELDDWDWKIKHEITEAQARDDYEDVVALLYDRYALRVRRMVFKKFGPEDREWNKDVCQEIWLTVVVQLRRYKVTESKFVGWLVVLAKHVCFSELRKLIVRKKHLTELEKPGKAIDTKSIEAPERAHLLRLEDDVRRAMVVLPFDLLKEFHAYFWEGKSYEDIARETGKPRSTIESRIERAVELVREALFSPPDKKE